MGGCGGTGIACDSQLTCGVGAEVSCGGGAGLGLLSQRQPADVTAVASNRH
jgi:hypothetical protein